MRPRCTDPLTPRELEITQLVACGLSCKEIALRLHRSTKTVTNTVQNIYVKHGINKESELTAFYLAVYHNVSVEAFDVVGKIKRIVGALAFVVVMMVQAVAIHDDCTARARRPNGRRGRHKYELSINPIEA